MFFLSSCIIWTITWSFGIFASYVSFFMRSHDEQLLFGSIANNNGGLGTANIMHFSTCILIYNPPFEN
jgi:hypothetical protein